MACCCFVVVGTIAERPFHTWRTVSPTDPRVSVPAYQLHVESIFQPSGVHPVLSLLRQAADEGWLDPNNMSLLFGWIPAIVASWSLAWTASAVPCRSRDKSAPIMGSRQRLVWVSRHPGGNNAPWFFPAVAVAAAWSRDGDVVPPYDDHSSCCLSFALPVSSAWSFSQQMSRSAKAGHQAASCVPKWQESGEIPCLPYHTAHSQTYNTLQYSDKMHATNCSCSLAGRMSPKPENSHPRRFDPWYSWASDAENGKTMYLTYQPISWTANACNCASSLMTSLGFLCGCCWCCGSPGFSAPLVISTWTLCRRRESLKTSTPFLGFPSILHSFPSSSSHILLFGNLTFMWSSMARAFSRLRELGKRRGWINSDRLV